MQCIYLMNIILIGVTMLHTSWSKLFLGVWFLVKAHPAHVMSVTWGFCSFPCELQVFYSAKQIAPLWAFEVR